MYYLNIVLNPIFHAIVYPFRDADPSWAVSWLSLITAVAALLIYRFFSEQEGIGAVKNRLKAHLLEARLFQHDPVLVGRAVLALLRSNVRYLRLNLKPFLFMFVPVVLILIQMEARYGTRALQAGDSIVVRAFWRAPGESSAIPADFSLEVDGGIELETPALRIADFGEANWRIRATAEGPAALRVRSAGGEVIVPVEVSSRIVPVSRWNGPKGSPKMLWNPAAKPLPGGGDLVSLEVDYPRRAFRFLGLETHWVWPYLVLSLLAGYLLKGVFRVQI